MAASLTRSQMGQSSIPETWRDFALRWRVAFGERVAGRLPDLLSAFIAALNEGLVAHRQTHARHTVAPCTVFALVKIV